MGYIMLQNPRIKQAIKDRRAELRKIEDESILAKLSSRARLQLERDRIATFDVKNIFDAKGNMLNIHEIPEDTRRAINSIEIKESFTDPESGITTVVKKITVVSKLTAIDKLDEFLEKRERESAEDGAIPKDATIIENGLQITSDYNQDIPDQDLMPEIEEKNNG